MFLKKLELTVREMPEVLICVEACLWKMFGVDLEAVVLSSPFRWTAYSPDGTSGNVTRKTSLSTNWREQPESNLTSTIMVYSRLGNDEQEKRACSVPLTTV